MNMARMARVVVPRYPHHVTQRGNRRLRTFFSNDDYRAYVDLIAKAKKQADVDIWAYCLMPNHVHFVVVPGEKDSLATLFREAHRRYTRRINFREGWRGHLWQERFFSSVMDEHHLIAAVRYVELNPIRARLCSKPTDWKWSSVHAHIRRSDDALVNVTPMLSRIADWDAYLSTPESQEQVEAIRMHSRTGRPVGDDAFIDNLERVTGRRLRRRQPGPAPAVK